MTNDERIIKALKNAEAQSKLGVVAAVTGVPKSELRIIIDTEHLLPMQRSLLHVHLSA